MDRVERTALISIGINIGLVIFKLTLAFLSGSLALVADAWHSGSDVAASGLVWTGARISRRGGRGNLAVIENVIGILIAALIFVAAVGIFRKVSAVSSSQIRNLPIAIVGSLVAALVSYYAAQYKLYVGRETGSMSLVADGYHSRMDMLTSVAVVIGLMGHTIGIGLDGVAAVVVGIFIIGSGGEILSASIAGLRTGTTTDTTGFAKLAETLPIRLLAGALERTGWSDRCRHCLSTLTRPRNRRRMVRLVIWAIVLGWLSTSLVFVGPGRQGVVMRLGSATTDTLGPGLHVTAPWPVDRVVRVEVSRLRRIEVGFRTREEPRTVTRVAEEFYATLWESRHAAGTYEKMPEEALRLTGDENVIDMNVVIFYHVSEVNDYVFNVAEREDYIRFIMESVMSKETGSLAIDDVLTVRRGEFEETLRARTQELLDSAGLGVEVTSVHLQDIHPPLEVVPAFRDVASAREDKNRIMNEAYGYANQTIPRARGEAEASILEAYGYSHALQSRATGDADRFVALAREHRKARAVTETRLYIETMESLLQGREKYIVSSDLKLRGYDIRVYDRKLSARVPMED